MGYSVQDRLVSCMLETFWEAADHSEILSIYQIVRTAAVEV